MIHIMPVLIAISRGPPNERNGEVYGFSFIYSGNFLIESEINDIGNLRVNIGIHPNGFSWRLESGSKIIASMS